MALSPPTAPTAPDLNSPSTYNARVLDGFTYCFETLPNWMAGLDASDYFSVQSGPLDVTAGVVLGLGAFGLGIASRVGGAIDICADADDINFRCDLPFDGTTLNMPKSGYGTLSTFARYAGGEKNQIALYVDDAYLYTRKQSPGGVWGAWRLIYAQNSIIGTVGLSSGVPDGALFETGSSGVNRYEKRADGVMECDGYVTTSTGGAVGITFPATFAGSASDVNLVVSAKTSASDYNAVGSVTSTSAASISAFNTAGSRVATTVYWKATGEWS